MYLKPIAASLACSTLLAGPCVARATSIRIEAWGSREHTLDVAPSGQWIVIQGNGNSDLDCWVYDEQRRLLDSDTNGTDHCVLETRGTGVHRVDVENVGNRPNRYVVTLKRMS